MDGRFSISKFLELGPIVGILRGNTLDEAMFIAECYEKAGLYALEVTMNTLGVEDIIPELSNKFPKLTIGAGTVKNSEDLAKAIALGAQFLVTPNLDKSVIAGAKKASIPIFSGAYSPTEIYKAWSLGVDAVKVFPATNLGSQYIKDILGPLNDVKLIPTGGVNKQNINEFFKAGAFGVGMGSSLINKELLAARNKNGLIDYLISIKNEMN